MCVRARACESVLERERKREWGGRAKFNVFHLILPFVSNNHYRKELDLLQKLYGLYDAVMSKIGGYYKTLWTAVDTDIINNELLDFQNRCNKYLCRVEV